MVFFCLISFKNTEAFTTDDEEGHTFDFSPYWYDIQTTFYDTVVPYGGGTVIPRMKLTSNFKVDEDFQEYFSKWWRVFASYVHEIEERKIEGSTTHYFDYNGYYVTNIQNTHVEYEIDPPPGDDPEWELHVRWPDNNLQPDVNYYVWSLWMGMNPLEPGTYSNSHWLTSEIAGGTPDAGDYDHLLRRTFTFPILPYRGGVGGEFGYASYDLEELSEEKQIPISILPSTYIADIRIPLFNSRITIKQITYDTFKVITKFDLTNDNKRETFNNICLSELQQKNSIVSTSRTTALIKLNNVMSFESLQQYANLYDWKINTVKMKYHSEDGEAYAHLSLFNNKVPEDVFDIFNIETDKIVGIYGLEIESPIEGLYNYYMQNTDSIEVFNLACLFVDDWLIENGYSPKSYTHVGFLGA